MNTMANNDNSKRLGWLVPPVVAISAALGVWHGTGQTSLALGMWLLVQVVWWFLAVRTVWQNVVLFAPALNAIGWAFAPLVFVGPLGLLAQTGGDPRLMQWVHLAPWIVSLVWLSITTGRWRDCCLSLETRQQAPRGTPFPWFWLVVVVTIVRAEQWLSVAITRHQNFYSHAYDMALMGNIMNNLVTGEGLTSSLLQAGGSFLGHHFSPILYLFAPFYFFFPHPECLLGIQSLALAGAAVPLFWLGWRWLGGATGAALALVYLAMPGLTAAQLFDFHTITLAPLFLFWTIAAIAGGRKFWWVPAILVLMLQENLFLYTSAVGMVLLFWPESRRAGLGLLAISLVWTAAVFMWLQPMFQPPDAPAFGFAWRYQDFLDPADPTTGLGTLLKKLLEHPLGVVHVLLAGARPATLWWMYGPVTGLLWLMPVCWPLAAPLLENLLSSDPTLHTFAVHYAVGPAMMGVLALTIGVYWLRRTNLFHHAWLALPWVVLLGVVWQQQLHPRLEDDLSWQKQQFARPLLSADTRLWLTTRFPRQASVAGQSNLLPHLTHIRELALLPPGRPIRVEQELPGDDQHLRPDNDWPDYLVYNPAMDFAPGWYNMWFYSPEQVREWCHKQEDSGNYVREQGFEGVVVLRKEK